jgi:hypothetical protein
MTAKRTTPRIAGSAGILLGQPQKNIAGTLRVPSATAHGVWPLRRARYFLPLALAALGLPACSSWGNGSGYPLFTNRNPNREYVVQRPTYGPDSGKPFFLGGYAGANYGPLFPRSRMQYEAGAVPVTPQPTVSVEHGAWDPE